MSEMSYAQNESRSQVGPWTVWGTLCCIAFALAFNSLTFSSLGGEAMRRSLVSATLLPLMLGAPFFFYLARRLQKLINANRHLTHLATTDSLTGCLNRGAFISRVGGALSIKAPAGALLVIDADNFKAVNDQFGHEAGDEALKLVARSIQVVLRAGDVMGRLGGEEFGVFLPATDLLGTVIVAERIRRSVNLALFAPGETAHPLSVSVGGTTFDQTIGFAELFRIADHRLYGAKKAGRNCLNIASLDDEIAAR